RGTSRVARGRAGGGRSGGPVAWSGKAGARGGDRGLLLHGVVGGQASGGGELKLWGRAVPADPGLGSAAKAWWSAYPPGNAVVFSLSIGQALFVAWGIDGGGMTVHQWSPRDGYCHRRPPYTSHVRERASAWLA